jgi:hypothetical protein
MDAYGCNKVSCRLDLLGRLWDITAKECCKQKKSAGRELGENISRTRTGYFQNSYGGSVRCHHCCTFANSLSSSINHFLDSNSTNTRFTPIDIIPFIILHTIDILAYFGLCMCCKSCVVLCALFVTIFGIYGLMHRFCIRRLVTFSVLLLG